MTRTLRYGEKRGMVIADKFSMLTLSLTGEEETECIEGSEMFKYLGRLLERSDGK